MPTIDSTQITVSFLMSQTPNFPARKILSSSCCLISAGANFCMRSLIAVVMGRIARSKKSLGLRGSARRLFGSVICAIVSVAFLRSLGFLARSASAASIISFSRLRNCASGLSFKLINLATKINHTNDARNATAKIIANHLFHKEKRQHLVAVAYYTRQVFAMQAA